MITSSFAHDTKRIETRITAKNLFTMDERCLKMFLFANNVIFRGTLNHIDT